MTLFRGLMLFLWVSLIAFAPPARSQTSADKPATPALTESDLGAWLDGFMPYAIDQAQIAGAVVVVVADGRVLVQRGYGFADVAARRPIDSERTLFRLASISKLVTATAVMQLVEAGDLDLDADINTYLDFAITPRTGGKVTLRHLLQHRAGFAERWGANPVLDPARPMPLAQTVKASSPPFIFEPGSTPAYSNYSAVLAGYIVARKSGLPFEEYVQQRIFLPLGMSRSTVSQTLPPTLRIDMANGYEVASGEAQPFEMFADIPAGGLSSTGADMAHFMLAHLQRGKLGDGQILRPETADLMHKLTPRVYPPLNGAALGFYEQSLNGERVLAHAGDIAYFRSNLALFMDRGVGLFVAFNSAGVSDDQPSTSVIRRRLLEEFADRYFPSISSVPKVDEAVAREHANLVAGFYLPSRRAQSGFLALLNLVGQVEVGANDDGTLAIQGSRYEEIEPFVWRMVGGHTRWAAVVEHEAVTRLENDFPFVVLSPAPPALSAGWVLPALFTAIGVLGVTLVLWPVSAIVRWRHGGHFALTGLRAWSYRLARVGALALLLSLGYWLWTFAQIGSPTNYPSPTVSSVLVPQAMAVLAGFIGIGFALFNVAAVWRVRRFWFAKLWSIAMFLAAAFIGYVGVAFQLVTFDAGI